MARTFAKLTNPTRGEQHAALINLKIKEVMATVAGDIEMLLRVVGGGMPLWRATVENDFRPYHLPPGVPERMFAFFAQQVVQRFGEPGQTDPKQVAFETLDALEIINPPTEQEIRDSWFIEDRSSPEGRQFIYGDEHPQEHLDRLVGRTTSLGSIN